MWYEHRTFGLVGKDKRTAQTVAWIVPNPESGIEWFARFVRYPEAIFHAAHLAWTHADSLLGNQIDWWVFRLEDNKPLRKLRRGSTR